MKSIVLVAALSLAFTGGASALTCKEDTTAKKLAGAAATSAVDATINRRDQEIRSRMKEVDAALSPRQRAELRFFIARFGREVEQRIRGDAGPARRGGRTPPRRPLPAPPAGQP